MLLAYAKMTLYEDLLETELPDRAYSGRATSAKYFPRPLRRRFMPRSSSTDCKREIVATWIANSVVNRGLDVFVSELEDETGATLEDVMLAYVAARDSFGLLPIWGAIEALPASVPGDVQTTFAGRGARRAAARHALVHDPGRQPFRIVDDRVAVPARHRDDHGAFGSGGRPGSMPRASRPARAEYVAGGRRAGRWPGPSPDCRICWRPATSCASPADGCRRCACCEPPASISRWTVRSTCPG